MNRMFWSAMLSIVILRDAFMLASVAHNFLIGDTICVLAHVRIFTRLPAVLSWAAT